MYHRCSEPCLSAKGSILRGFIASLLSVVFVLFSANTIAAKGDTEVNGLARAVDEHYNRLTSLQADFVETYQGAGADRTESGTLWLKKPGKMRWEYRSPKEKLFLSDGKDAWFYLPQERQVHRAPVKQLDDLRSPLGLLLGRTRLEKELQGLSLATDLRPVTPGNSVLRGIPKRLGDRFSEVLIEVTPANRIARLVIEEAGGAATEYRFSNQIENRKVPESQFRFVPPEGVEVIDGDFGG